MWRYLKFSVLCVGSVVKSIIFYQCINNKNASIADWIFAILWIIFDDELSEVLNDLEVLKDLNDLQ